MPESAEAKRLKQEKLKAKEARLVKEKESGRRINEDVNRDLTGDWLLLCFSLIWLRMGLDWKISF